MEEDNLCG